MFAGYFVFSSLLNSERMQISVQPLANCWNTLSTFHQRPEKTEHENNPEACSATWSLVPLHTLRCGTLVSNNFDVVPRPHNRWSWPWLDWLDGIAATSPYRPHLTCAKYSRQQQSRLEIGACTRIAGCYDAHPEFGILNFGFGISTEKGVISLAISSDVCQVLHLALFTYMCVCVCFLVFFWNMITLTTC